MDDKRAQNLNTENFNPAPEMPEQTIAPETVSETPKEEAPKAKKSTNRALKNTLMSLALVLLICANVGTVVGFGANNTTIFYGPGEMQGEAPSDIGNAPEMPSGDSSDSDSTTPPDLPSGEAPSDMGEAPEKPDGESSDDTTTPPEKPDGDDSSDTSSRPSRPSSTSSDASTDSSDESTDDDAVFNDLAMGGSETSDLTAIEYVVFAVEDVLIGLIAIYLILSKFNAKTFKQTFEGGEKIMIFILTLIILTVALVFADKAAYENIDWTDLAGSETSGFSIDDADGSKLATTTTNIDYSSATTLTEDTTITSAAYASETEDENAIAVDGATVTLDNITVSKTGDSDGGDNTSFYGTNSAIIAKNGATLTITNSTIETNATGANAVFSYGGNLTSSTSDDTVINISDSTITTYKDNSGGIMVTGGGVLYASNLTVTTSGTSSAAIRSDRGSGSMNVNGGTYTTNGQGSPAIYSTAEIVVENADLVANVSEGVVIEGKNSVYLENVNLTDNNTRLNGKSTTYKNIFLYQSMSGDADSGTSTFTAVDSTITTNNGDVFYITNTDAVIYLDNNIFITNSDGAFLRAEAGAWGTSGKNGGNVTLSLSNQTVEGDIVIDSVSTLEMNITNGSSYTGTINGDNTASTLSLYLDEDSTLTLTGDSYVTEFSDDDADYSNINFNGYTLYVNGEALN